MKSNRMSIVLAAFLLGGLLWAGSPAKALTWSHVISAASATVPGFTVAGLGAVENPAPGSGSVTINSIPVTINCVVVFPTNTPGQHSVFMRGSGGGNVWFVTLVENAGSQSMSVTNTRAVSTPCNATGAPVPLTSGSFTIIL